MKTETYKCPCCGAALTYDGGEEKLVCRSCGTQFDAAGFSAAEQYEAEDAGFERIDWSTRGGREGDPSPAHVYVCQSCGAELVTDENTTATECAYCGSPIVLTSNLISGVKPEYVLPFRISEEQARKMFSDYFHGKRLIPNIFETTRNRISEIRRLYVPYWLFSCKADANMTYSATRISVHMHGDYEETRTRHYLVRRAGSLNFEGIPVDGSEKLDNRITESLEPFDFAEAIEFTPATLSGSLADRPDVSMDDCFTRANERLHASTREAFRSTVIGFDTVSERSCGVHVENGQAVPVLLPVWLIRTEKDVKGTKVAYTFAINGQTGKLTCDVPFSRGRAVKWFFSLTAAITAGGYALLALLAALGVVGGGLL